MYRWTARWLLVLALVGNFAPVALALSAAPPAHACCVRKAAQAHPCHGMTIGESEQLAIRSTGCCHQDCCRSVTVDRWAQAEPVAVSAHVQDGGFGVAHLRSDSPVTALSEFHSTRAPPQICIA